MYLILCILSVVGNVQVLQIIYLSHYTSLTLAIIIEYIFTSNTNNKKGIISILLIN